MTHSLRRQMVADQAANHLREGIASGRWQGAMPGVLALARECDVSPVTMRAALRLLEQEGWIQNHGPGRPRMATSAAKPHPDAPHRPLRIRILPGMDIKDEDAAFQHVLLQLQRDLEGCGHECRFIPKSQESLNRNVTRIRKLVEKSHADAWIVIAGDRPCLEWFAKSRLPTLAIGGIIPDGLPIASTGVPLSSALTESYQRLIELGHRRILTLVPPSSQDITNSSAFRILSEALAKTGTEATRYHLPEWKGTSEDLQQVLEKSFQFTPPTAIVATYGNWMAGVLSFLAEHGLRSPRDISLICLNSDSWFAWKHPQITHLAGDDSKIIRFIVRWANGVARGNVEQRSVLIPQTFIEGGTIGQNLKAFPNSK